jgi:hypothetical protein
LLPEATSAVERMAKFMKNVKHIDATNENNDANIDDDNNNNNNIAFQ